MEKMKQPTPTQITSILALIALAIIVAMSYEKGTVQVQTPKKDTIIYLVEHSKILGTAD